MIDKQRLAMIFDTKLRAAAQAAKLSFATYREDLEGTTQIGMFCRGFTFSSDSWHPGSVTLTLFDESSQAMASIKFEDGDLGAALHALDLDWSKAMQAAVLKVMREE